MEGLEVFGFEACRSTGLLGLDRLRLFGVKGTFQGKTPSMEGSPVS